MKTDSGRGGISEEVKVQTKTPRPRLNHLGPGPGAAPVIWNTMLMRAEEMDEKLFRGDSNTSRLKSLQRRVHGPQGSRFQVSRDPLTEQHGLEILP